MQVSENESQEVQEIPEVIEEVAAAVTPSPDLEMVAELSRRNQELQAQIDKLNQPAVHELPPRPNIQDCDFDVKIYDEKMDLWYQKKNEYEARDRAQKEENQRTYQETQNRYLAQKQALNQSDYAQSESIVSATLNQDQQAILLQSADDIARVVYALGKNPAKAREFAAIKNPLRLASAIARYEGSLGVTHEVKRAPPPTDKPLSGSGTSSRDDAELERLRRDAEKSGDYTNVVRYRTELRSKRKA